MELEKAIKRLENIKTYLEIDVGANIELTPREQKFYAQNIGVLLDLYQKEKNKLSDKEKEIIEAYRKLVKVTGIATGWVICYPATMWSEYFISKDKIKEKIKECEKLIETNSLYEENWNKIEALKELLEE